MAKSLRNRKSSKNKQQDNLQSSSNTGKHQHQHESKKTLRQMRKKKSNAKSIKNGTVIILMIVVLLAANAMFYVLFPVDRYEPKIRIDFIDGPFEEGENKDSKIYEFLSTYICQDRVNEGYCHPLLRPSAKRRTHYVGQTSQNSTIRRGEVVLNLPRAKLISDLDALRDTYIQKELLSARHERTANPLDSGAFLAAYLSRMYKIVMVDSKGEKSASDYKDMDMYDDFKDFLTILPNHKDMIDHPTQWSEKKLLSLFGKSSLVYRLVVGYREMITSEYNAFSRVSPNFESYIDLDTYTVMRLNVMSRSFGTGPPSAYEEMKDQTSYAIKEELIRYEEKAGVNLTNGCRAMSPILDMWDHHANPNVKWMYDTNLQAFIIQAVTTIHPGHDIMVSYGKYTDTHLFAKFGFVNGDGSGYIEGSIAGIHTILDQGMGHQFSYMTMDNNMALPPAHFSQKQELLHYLTFDDGHDECVKRKDDSDSFKLKTLKFIHLQHIANLRDRWVLKISPRNPTSKPAMNSRIPIMVEAPKFDSKKVKFDGSKLISTCRLLALTTNDFGGDANEVLSEVLRNNTAKTFMIARQTDELEFRALTWLARLTSISLSRYPSTVPKDIEALMSSDLEFRSKEWSAAHVRLGEMQTLEVLRSIATSGARQMLNNIKGRDVGDDDDRSIYIRHKPCPLEYSQPLMAIDEVELQLRY